MSEHEPEWMRDKRLKDEEARMVQIESHVGSIKTTMEAIRESFEEERKLRRRAEERLEEHEHSDNTRFSSIDSRLQGIQTQLSTINDTQSRIEKKVDTGAADHEARIKILESDAIGHTAVTRWLRLAWVQLGIGVSIGGTLVGAYALLA
jgi:chromosome segregation ATPase